MQHRSSQRVLTSIEEPYFAILTAADNSQGICREVNCLYHLEREEKREEKREERGERRERREVRKEERRERRGERRDEREEMRAVVCNNS